MIPLPKPRGFWDYALFALMMTGLLSFLFWLEASDGVGWADAALASASAVFLVFAIILARRGEKAAWIKQPTWHVYPAAALGVLAVMFGAIYADAYLLHHRDLAPNRLRRDVVVAIVSTAGIVSSLLRRFFRAKRQVS
jgi:hypothetical protein